MGMEALSSGRRLIVYICLMAVFLAAISPGSSGLVCAILVPLLLFIATVIVPRVGESESSVAPACPIFSAVPSRAPPRA